MTYNQATPVKIRVEGAAPTTHLALSPGGPYVAASIAVPAVRSVAFAGDYLLQASTVGELAVVDYAQAQPVVVGKIKFPGTITKVAVQGKLGFAAVSGVGLVVLDLSQPRAPKRLGQFNMASPLRDFAVSGQRAWLLLGQQEIAIVDLTDPAKPHLLTRHRLTQPALRLAADGVYGYVAVGEHGLIVLDGGSADLKEAGRFKTSGAVLDVAIAEGLAYVADGRAGLTILNIADPAHITLSGSNNKLGHLERIAVDQARGAGANSAGQVILLDLSRPDLPLAITRLALRQNIHGLSYQQGRAFVATTEGVHAIDFANEAPPLLSDEGVNLGGSRRGFIRDNLLYVADWFSGLHIYDISSPSRLLHVGNFHTPGSSKGVVVRGDFAFVGDDDHGLQILNVKDPRNPVRVSEIATPGLAYTMKLVGDLLYLADHRGGLHVIDVSDVTQPKMLGSASTQGKAWAVEVSGQTALVAADKAGLMLFDVSNPAQMRVIGQFNPGGAAEDVRVSGTTAYVSFFDKGLYVLDIAEPTQPKLIGSLPIPGNARGLDLIGSLLYVAAWEAGLQVVDVADTAAPKIIGYYDTSGSAWGVNVAGNYAYVLDWWGGVKVVNVRDPAAPVLAGKYHAADKVLQIALDGKFAYAASGPGGVQVFDVSNSINPIWVTGVDFPGSAQGVAVGQKYLYVAAGDGGLAVLDISNPFQTRWAGQLATPGKVSQVRIQGDKAWLVDSKLGLVLVSISDPIRPRLLASYKASINDLWNVGDTLFLATQDRGVVVLDASDPAKIIEQERFATKGSVDLVRADSDLVFLHQPGVGIRVLQRSKGGLKQLSLFATAEHIADMQLAGDTLYLTSAESGLKALDISRPSALRVKAVYPASVPISRMALKDNQIFFAGENIISSVALIPDVAISRAGENFTVTVPKGMAMGSYDLVAVTPGRPDVVWHNALTVKLPKGKKPKLTIEEFQKLLKQQRGEGVPKQ